MSRQRTFFWIPFCVIALLGLPSLVPAQQEGEMLQLALPRDVFVVVGQSLVIITGRPTSASPVTVQPGSRDQPVQWLWMKVAAMPLSRQRSLSFEIPSHATERESESSAALLCATVTCFCTKGLSNRWIFGSRVRPLINVRSNTQMEPTRR